jgi:hypothetical protein
VGGRVEKDLTNSGDVETVYPYHERWTINNNNKANRQSNSSSSSKWCRMEPMPTSRYGAVACSIEIDGISCILVCGGKDARGRPLERVECITYPLDVGHHILLYHVHVIVHVVLLFTKMVYHTVW